MAEVKLNQLPAPTFRWLRVNEARVKDVCLGQPGAVAVEVPEAVAVSEGPDAGLEKIAGGCGREVDELFAGRNFRKYTLYNKEETPLRFAFSGKEGDYNRIGIVAEEGSEGTIIMDLRGSGFSAVQTKILAKAGATLRLVQVQKADADARLINDVGVCLGEGASLETIQLILGGKETYLGLRTELASDTSASASQIGYLLDEDQVLDMNYLASHTAAKTGSKMDVSGVLRGRAKKTFRGTIDFCQGAVGAKGDEKEDVLMLSDEVRNCTIPLILCCEEDVEGNHGATIGRLDESLLFYLMSRGMDEAEIYEMMARARIDAICAQIPDERTQKLVQAYLGAKEESTEDE